MILIGIDYSLNSPAITIIENNVIKKIISISREDKSKEYFLKKQNNPYQHLEESEEIEVLFLKKRKVPNDYIKKERIKFEIFEEINNLIIEKINKYINNQDIFIGMEGLAFGAVGDALIDISMATHSLRIKLINDILKGDKDRFFVFSPATIKKNSSYKLQRETHSLNLLKKSINLKSKIEDIEKILGPDNHSKYLQVLDYNKKILKKLEKEENNDIVNISINSYLNDLELYFKYLIKGSAKKWEMYESLIFDKLKCLDRSDYIELIKNNKEDWILPKSLNVRKPLDDINDSIWICECLLDNLGHLDNKIY